MPRRARVALGGLLIATTALALVGARPYAGSWNDGSRLAAAESLVDGNGWTIDHSIFVEPANRPAAAPAPYPLSDRLLSERGTLDRLLIDGRYVSDKTPISNLILAGEYWLLQRTTGLVARSQADRFVRWLTILSSGLSFVVATAAMFVVAWRATRSTGIATGVAASVSFATCAAAYSRHVNGHEMLLAVFAMLLLQVDGVMRRPARTATVTQAWSIGTLAGLAYGLDAVLGPLAAGLAVMLFACVCRSRVWLLLFAVSPWVVLHHALNYLIGHTLAPPSSVEAYLAWPGSPFDAESMTGRYTHPTVGHALLYSVDLLAGRRGFLLHNLPLLAVPAAAWRIAQRPTLNEWPAVVFSVTLCLGGWIVYALGSTNHSGVALSIRWFVPLLAPLFYVLAIDLGTAAAGRLPFIVLSVAGTAMGWSAWLGGPWQQRVPLFWWWLALALMACAVLEWRRWKARAA